jgi:H+/gluconate symporter-like permease
MKKEISSLYLLLVCAISYALIFVGVPYFSRNPSMFSDFGGLVPALAFIIIWGVIFMFFGVKKLIGRRQ